ncbi:MAG: RtcB family protein [Alistipes sp.]|nr:RtcB family protein [Rikenellaceae bacterium]MBQ7310030.1 RtcB family protein [Alistipes sp.]
MEQIVGRYCKDCVVYSNTLEQDARSIIYSFVNHRMFEGSKIRIMPDVHAGKDIVVGFTAPFRDCVNPDHIGGDIGCTVSTTITATPVVSEQFEELERQIRHYVKFGMTQQEHTMFKESEFYAFLKKRVAEARVAWSEYVDNADVSERGIEKLLNRVEMNAKTFFCQIGTVGSGNHFVEIGVTPEGNYAITVHCGSRNFGQKVWKYWHTIAHNPTFNHPSVGYLAGEQMRGYITDMVIAQAYAEFNHIIIHRLITDIFRRVCGSVDAVEQIITTHNYIDFKGRMMRKGAVASLEGQKLVIPFNMRDGLIICKGKSNPEWNCSAPHGAGRLMSRSAAKELIDMEEYKQSMANIYSTSVQRDTIDESPMAYKDPMEILEAIQDTVEVLYFIKPVINMKSRSEDLATDEELD